MLLNLRCCGSQCGLGFAHQYGKRGCIVHGEVGFLSEDLREAAMQALTIDRARCREYAAGFSWKASARQFIENIRTARPGLSAP